MLFSFYTKSIHVQLTVEELLHLFPFTEPETQHYVFVIGKWNDGLTVVASDRTEYERGASYGQGLYKMRDPTSYPYARLFSTSYGMFGGYPNRELPVHRRDVTDVELITHIGRPAVKCFPMKATVEYSSRVKFAQPVQQESLDIEQQNPFALLHNQFSGGNKEPVRLYEESSNKPIERPINELIQEASRPEVIPNKQEDVTHNTTAAEIESDQPDIPNIDWFEVGTRDEFFPPKNDKKPDLTELKNLAALLNDALTHHPDIFLSVKDERILVLEQEVVEFEEL